MEYLLIALSLLLTTSGQLLQKLGASRAAALPEDTHFIVRALRCRETWWAVICLAAGAATWLAVLYRMEVSKAFPFLSLGFVLVLLVSRYRLHEHISRARWTGVALIVAGILLVSRT